MMATPSSARPNHAARHLCSCASAKPFSQTPATDTRRHHQRHFRRQKPTSFEIDPTDDVAIIGHRVDGLAEASKSDILVPGNFCHAPPCSWQTLSAQTCLD